MNPKPHPRDEEREERIDREIVVDCNDEYEVRAGWHCYLESTMSFPFKAKCLLARKSSPLLPGERVSVAGMDDDEENELGEMKVRVKWQGREFSVPLAQLAGIGVDEDTEEAIADWHYWAAQGRRF